MNDTENDTGKNEHAARVGQRPASETQVYDYHPVAEISEPKWLVRGNESPLIDLLERTAKAIKGREEVTLDDRLDLRWFRRSLQADADPRVILGDSILREGVVQALATAARAVEAENTHLHEELQSAANEIARSYNQGHTPIR